MSNDSVFDFEDNTNQVSTDISTFEWGSGATVDRHLAILAAVDSVAAAYVPKARTGRKVPATMRDEEDRKDAIDYTKIRVAMSASALDYTKSEVPWAYLSYQPTDPHDHPISHFLTEINEAKVVERFGNEPFIDLFGNPMRQKRYGRNSVSYVSKKTAKDYVRAFKPDGQRVRKFKTVEQVCSEHPTHKHVLMTHSAYYLTVDEIGALLHHGELAGERRAYAIVHRHPNQGGFLNNGELEYGYVDANTVLQWSASTKEAYKHQSMEPWFHQSACNTSSGPIAWTTKKLAGDSFLLEMVAARGLEKTGPLPELAENKPEVAVAMETGSYKVYQFLGQRWVSYQGPNGDSIRLNDVELFEILRRHIAGRERSPTTKKDLTLLARRLCDKRDIFAKYSSEHDVKPEHLMAYVEAAFHADLQAEIDLMLSYRREHAVNLSMHAALLENPAAYDNTWLQTAAQTGTNIKAVVSPAVAIAVPAAKTAASVVADAVLSAALQVPLVATTGQYGLHQGITARTYEAAKSVLGSMKSGVASTVIHDDIPAEKLTVQLLEAMTTAKTVREKRVSANTPLPGAADAPPPYRIKSKR